MTSTLTSPPIVNATEYNLTKVKQSSQKSRNSPDVLHAPSNLRSSMYLTLDADLRKHTPLLKTTWENNFRVSQNKSNVTIYYQSGKYVLCQLHGQFKDIKSKQDIKFSKTFWDIRQFAWKTLRNDTPSTVINLSLYSKELYYLLWLSVLLLREGDLFTRHTETVSCV